MLIGSLALAAVGAPIAVGVATALGSGTGARTRPARQMPRSIRPAPLRARPSRRANVQLAEHTARRLLEEVPLPEGARTAGSDESVLGNLQGPAAWPATPQLVGKHRFWRVAGQPQAVISSIEDHPPAGSTITTHGSSGKSAGPPPRSLHGRALGRWVRQHTVTTSWDATFAFNAQRERLAMVWLSVTVAAAKGGGSEIRADALVVWRRPRPAAEHIPRSVREITLQVNDPRRHLRFTRQVGSPRKVRAIVAVIEGLQQPEAGARSCPVENGKAPVIDLLFRERKGGPPLVRVHIDGNGCGSVAFHRGTRQQPALGEAWEAIKQLHRVLGRTV